MATIEVNVSNQVLAFTNMPVITSGDSGADKIKFNFSSEWSAFAKVVVFYKQKGEFFYSLVNSNNECDIPNEMVLDAGTIHFGVVGKDEELYLDGTSTKVVTITSTILKYKIQEGSYVTVDEPSQSLYEQIITELASIESGITGVNDKVTVAQNDISEINEKLDSGLESSTLRNLRLTWDIRETSTSYPFDEITLQKWKTDGLKINKLTLNSDGSSESGKTLLIISPDETIFVPKKINSIESGKTLLNTTSEGIISIPDKIKCGISFITTSAKSVVSKYVTFYTPFPQNVTPSISLTPASTEPQNVNISVAGVTNIGFYIKYYHATLSNEQGVHWIAIAPDSIG